MHGPQNAQQMKTSFILSIHMNAKLCTNTCCTATYILQHKYSITNQIRYFISQAIPQDWNSELMLVF